MSTTLLVTKLYIPRARLNLVSRPRLTARLNQSQAQSLTLIAAPAGFGKTTLLSEWIPQSEQCVCWLSLDGGDNDPARFWMYVIGAIQMLETSLGESALALLQSAQPLPLESILTLLLNDLATFRDRFSLVLDDYHVITTQAIHDSVAFALDHLPPQMQLVITSRVDPLLPLARLRARGLLNELRTNDLRFRPDEAAAFLNQVMGLTLSADDIEGLETRTEGWIAGLQLAGLSMQGRDDVHGFIQAFTGSHAYIVDYLVEEILQRQPDNTQRFLLHTSILDRLSGPVCDAVTGQGDSQAMLERLQHANLFIIPLDNERQWYRYHHLFADVLRQRLQQSRPDLVPELHRRASTWFEQSQLMTEAIQHAIAATDFQRAAHLIEQVAPIWLPGSVETLHSLIDTLPTELVRARPHLSLIYCWILGLTGQLDRVEARLDEIERDITAAPELPDRGSILGEVIALRAQLAMNSNRPLDIGELRAGLAGVPENSLRVRSLLTVMLGYAEREAGHVAAATRAYAEASLLAQKQEDIFVAVGALVALAELQEVQGQLHQAARTHRQAIQLATTRTGRPLPMAGMSHVGLAKQLREWNDLEQATRHLQEGIGLGQQAGIQGIEIDGCITLALVRLAQGDWEGAQTTLQRAAQIAQSLSLPSIILRVATFEAQLGLARGEWQVAARWAQANGLRVDDELHEWLEIEYGTLARLLIVQRKPEEALYLLNRLQSNAEAAGRMGRVIEMLALRALAFQVNGDSAASLSALERALSLAEPEGYIRTFIDLGPAMLELLKRILPHNQTGYVQQLITAFSGIDREPVVQAGSPIDPLTEREIEVLRLIAAGLSNKEIAEHLFLTEGTVKGYASTIYDKLGVRRRTEAVERARDLGIL